PGPVQTAVGAIVALTAVQKAFPRHTGAVTSAVSGMASGISSSFARVRDEVVLQRALATNMGKTYDGLGPAFTRAGKHASGFRTDMSALGSVIGKSAKTGVRGAASSLMGLMGGPWAWARPGPPTGGPLWASGTPDAR